MTTKKEPVAFDLAEVGERRPVLSVPDKRPVGRATATTQAVASMTLRTLEPGFQIFRNNSSHVTTRPGDFPFFTQLMSIGLLGRKSYSSL